MPTNHDRPRRGKKASGKKSSAKRSLAVNIDNAERRRLALQAVVEDAEPSDEVRQDAQEWIDCLFAAGWNARLGLPAGIAKPGVPMLMVWYALGRRDLA
jgi:hypothetical protein